MQKTSRAGKHSGLPMRNHPAFPVSLADEPEFIPESHDSGRITAGRIVLSHILAGDTIPPAGRQGLFLQKHQATAVFNGLNLPH